MTPQQIQDAMMPNWWDDVPEGVRPEPFGLSLRQERHYVMHGFSTTHRNHIDQLVRCGDEIVFYSPIDCRYEPAKRMKRKVRS